MQCKYIPLNVNKCALHNYFPFFLFLFTLAFSSSCFLLVPAALGGVGVEAFLRIDLGLVGVVVGFGLACVVFLFFAGGVFSSSSSSATSSSSSSCFTSTAFFFCCFFLGCLALGVSSSSLLSSSFFFGCLGLGCVSSFLAFLLSLVFLFAGCLLLASFWLSGVALCLACGSSSLAGSPLVVGRGPRVTVVTAAHVSLAFVCVVARMVPGNSNQERGRKGRKKEKARE